MEVMIATAILAIGTLAIMALFPIGAVNMARAINQNRAADHAQNSDGIFRLYWKRAWLDPNGGGILARADAINNNPNEQMLVFLDAYPIPNAQPMIIQASSAQPSFPVLIDPIGFRTQIQNGALNQQYVAGQVGMPVRCNLAATPFPGPYTPTIRNTTMLDEFSYDRNGEPSALTGQLDRGGRYNVSWLIQRPNNSVADQVNLTVLVFAGRSPTDTPSNENVFPAVAQGYQPLVDPKPKSLTITYNPNNGTPGFLKGKWIAFTTPIQPQPAAPNGTGVQYPAFDFYRIAAVTDNGGTLDVELEQPLRTYDLGTPPGTALPGWQANGNLNGSVIFFDNLFEVFDRGTVSASAIAGR
jgi:hypothetical protein